MILERADFAAARGARVLGRLAGFGITADGYHITGPDPTGAGQIRAMRKALADAGLEPPPTSSTSTATRRPRWSATSASRRPSARHSDPTRC